MTSTQKRRATLAAREYCIDNPLGWVGYGENVWGLTASDGPTGYNARGAPPAQNVEGRLGEEQDWAGVGPPESRVRAGGFPERGGVLCLHLDERLVGGRGVRAVGHQAEPGDGEQRRHERATGQP